MKQLNSARECGSMVMAMEIELLNVCKSEKLSPNQGKLGHLIAAV